MTLLRQLVIAITFLVVCLLAANLVVSVINSRAYMYEQLKVQSEDTATSLGFTLSQAAKDKDIAQLNSMVDVIFDRGYYRHIVYRDLKGEVVVERHSPINIEGVPQWFIDYVRLPEPSGRAEIVSGWFRLGHLEVVGHPGYAYRNLWRVFREQLWLFAFTAVLSYGLAGMALRYLLRPLQRLEEQADAICRREFPVQDNLPRTRELRRMVIAMNRMTQKIKDMFQEQVALTEKLHHQSHLDEVTELSNRRDFDARVEAFIKSERGGCAAALLLIQVDNMQQLNDQHGRQEGDLCLRRLADVMREQVGDLEDAVIARRSGADFSVFVPGLESADYDALAEKLFKSLITIEAFNGSDVSMHMGMAYQSSVTLGNDLLAQADLALRQAQHRGESNWQGVVVDDGRRVEKSARTAGAWLLLLNKIIEQRSMKLHYQPVYSVDNQVVHVEVLSRLFDGDRLINAGVFWPMVERFNLGVELDRLIIEELQTLFVEEAIPYDLCVNLSPRSIQDPVFIHWLDSFLDVNPSLTTRLIFELPEKAIVLAEKEVRAFAEMLKSHKARLSIDHFGASTQAFSYLQSLPLWGLKVDRCFIQAINENQDNQFFVKSLVQIANSCDLQIVAEGIETEAEWDVVKGLGLHAGQGYHLGKPSEDFPKS